MRSPHTFEAFSTDPNVRLASISAIGYGAALLVIGWCLGADKAQRTLIYLGGALGGILGWIAGIYVSPFLGEEQRFSRLSTAISGFVSGYLLSKLDPVIRQGMQDWKAWDVAVIERFSFGIAWFLLAFVYTFTTRNYRRRRLTLDPEEVSLNLGSTQRFRVILDGRFAGLNWRVEPTVGTIAADGVYTAPTTGDQLPEVLWVVVSSVDNPTICAAAKIKIETRAELGAATHVKKEAASS